MKFDHFLGGEGILTPGDAAVALIVVDETHYLMQRRDQMPGIFYPDHWGLFGGALDDEEHEIGALRRELREELRLEFGEARYFTEFSMDFTFNGRGKVRRSYYELPLPRWRLDDLTLGEGVEMRLFRASEILLGHRVVPYDAFAIWMHATQRTEQPAAANGNGE